MLKQLLIKNFQAHKRTELEFHPGVNVIVPGEIQNPNNIGKTSIVRAILMLVKNSPAGAKWFHNRSKTPGKIFIRARFDDCGIVSLSRKIAKSKTGELKVKESIYRIEDHRYKGFGRSVPEPVLKAINLDEDINFQREDDPSFLISQSSGEITKAITRSTGLDKAEILLKTANKKVDEARRDIRDAENRVSLSEQRIKELRGIEKIGVLIKETESLETRIKELKSAIERIDDHFDVLSQFNKIKTGPGEALFIALDRAEEAKVRRSKAVKGLIRHGLLLKAFKEAKKMENAAKTAYESAKKKLGVCPTCDRPF